MGTFKDNFGNEYMDPYIPQKIVGFIGIDPDIVGSGGNGSGTGSGIDDHEQLRNLLGGDSTGHYHVTKGEWEKLVNLLTYGTFMKPDNSGRFAMMTDVDECNLYMLFAYLGLSPNPPDSRPAGVDGAIAYIIDKYIQDNASDADNPRVSGLITTLKDFIDARIAKYMASQSGNDG